MNYQPRPTRNRLYRSSKESVFFGVCGGIAEHFDLAPWAIRLIAIVITLMSGGLPVVLIYIILGFTLKKAPPVRFDNYEDEEFWNTYQDSRSAALRKIHRTFERLEKRLQRMETIVTSPGFELEDKFKNL